MTLSTFPELSRLRKDPVDPDIGKMDLYLIKP